MGDADSATQDLLALLGKCDRSLRSFGAADRDFLRAIVDAGGEATTTEIRDRGALKRKQIHHRYDSLGPERLGEYALVEVDRADPSDPHAANTARLTEYGRALVDAGLLDVIDDPNATVEELSRQLQSVEQRLDTLEARLEDMSATVDDVEPYLRTPDDSGYSALAGMWEMLIPALYQTVFGELPYRSVEKTWLTEEEKDTLIYDYFEREGSLEEQLATAVDAGIESEVEK